MPTEDAHPSSADADWNARVAAAWQRMDTQPPEALLAAIDALADERPADDAAALFERACVRDTLGLESEAEPLYRAALARGTLDAYRRARAALQLGSTLRWLGRLAESESLLTDELARQASPGARGPLHDEAHALLALTRIAQGRAEEAAGLALAALAPHLSRYQRSVGRQAALLIAKNVA